MGSRVPIIITIIITIVIIIAVDADTLPRS